MVVCCSANHWACRPRNCGSSACSILTWALIRCCTLTRRGCARRASRKLLGSYTRFQHYFAPILDLIAAAKPGDALERQAIKALVFPEVQEAALGYAEASNAGRGVTPDVARRLYATAKAIIDAGIKNPSIFEVAVLFEEKFGPDLISDMTIFLLLEDLGRFNKRVVDKVGLKTVEKTVHGKTGTFVYSKSQDQAVLVIPHSILADLPVATDWSEIDGVCAYNESLRKRINEVVQKVWIRRVQNLSKSDIKAVLLQRPDLLRELLVNYAKAKAEPYDFDSDPRGQVICSSGSPVPTASQTAWTYPASRRLAEAPPTSR